MADYDYLDRSVLVADIADFHEKFELQGPNIPQGLDPDLHAFRSKFMQEELDEYNTAYINLQFQLGLKIISQKKVAEALANQLDALVDLVYVAIGTAHMHGFDFDKAWNKVHHANMQKIRVKSANQSKRGSEYDVIKPEGWQPPDHTPLVKDNKYSRGI